MITVCLCVRACYMFVLVFLHVDVLYVIGCVLNCLEQVVKD